MKTTMSTKQEQLKSKKKQKYAQKFLEKWLEIFHPWLTRCDNDPNKPFCRACQCRLFCDRCHLQRHEQSNKHKRNLEVLLTEGEEAVRKNICTQQDRRKNHQQRKQFNSLSEFGSDPTDEEFVTTKDPVENGEPERETAFQFVTAETASSEQYTEETYFTQGTNLTHNQGEVPATSVSRQTKLRNSRKNNGEKKERMKLLLQIQKDKNDLMDSFREMGSVSHQQLPPKEKNHVDLFFESVSSSVKALSPKSISETKMRVSQLICELELRAHAKKEANACEVAVDRAEPKVVPSDSGDISNSFIINKQAHVITQDLSTERDRRYDKANS